MQVKCRTVQLVPFHAPRFDILCRTHKRKASECPQKGLLIILIVTLQYSHESTDFPVLLFCATTYCTPRNVIMLYQYSTVLYLSIGIRSVLFYSKIDYTLKEDVGERLE